MLQKEFKASLTKNIIGGLMKGIMLGFLLMMILLIMELKVIACYLSPFVGFVIGILFQIVTKSRNTITVDDDAVYFSRGRNKKYEFKFSDSQFRLSVHVQMFIFIPIKSRSLIVDTNGKRKVISCSFLSKKDCESLSSLIGQKMILFAPSNSNIGDSLTKKYIIPKKHIIQSMTQKSRVGLITISVFLSVVFLWVLISAAIQNKLDEYFMFIILPFLFAALIFGTIFICLQMKWRNIKKSIPDEVEIGIDSLYIGDKSYSYSGIDNMTMTPIKGGTDGFRRIIIDYSGEKDTYCFGFINDKENIFSQYVDMFLSLQGKLQEKFSYETL
ncbi:MAG: hypothetical protein IJZ64_05500 [Ruminococcus sp.]|nr:hypothetical protein [Ruminococcus sp.]